MTWRGFYADRVKYADKWEPTTVDCFCPEWSDDCCRECREKADGCVCPPPEGDDFADTLDAMKKDFRGMP